MSITSGVYASKPLSHNSGDLYLPSDSFWDFLFSDGASWKHILNGFECTPPSLADFSWVNQGTATVTTANGGIAMRAVATAGNSLRILKKTAPATPYTLTAIVIPCIAGIDGHYPHVGILFRERSSGRLLTLSLEFNVAAGGPGGSAVSNFGWESATASGLRYVAARADVLAGSPIWMRLEDDGANMKMSFSCDGLGFIQIRSVAYATQGMHPDEIGFFAQANSNTYDSIATLVHWDKPASADTAQHYGFWRPPVSVQSGASHVGTFQ